MSRGKFICSMVRTQTEICVGREGKPILLVSRLNISLYCIVILDNKIRSSNLKPVNKTDCSVGNVLTQHAGVLRNNNGKLLRFKFSYCAEVKLLSRYSESAKYQQR